MAAKDASDFAGFLTDPEGGRFRADRVRRIVDKEATLEGVKSGIGWLRENVGPEDLVVIYVASHGTLREIDPNGVSYIAVHDTRLNSIYATSLQMVDSIQTVSRELRARLKIVFLDTCFSGDASRDIRIFKPGSVSAANPASPVAFSGALQFMKLGKGRAVITASRADQNRTKIQPLATATSLTICSRNCGGKKDSAVWVLCFHWLGKRSSTEPVADL